MKAVIKLKIKHWLIQNLKNFLSGVFVYTPKYYIEFYCDSIEEVTEFVKKIPERNTIFSVTVSNIKEK